MAVLGLKVVRCCRRTSLQTDITNSGTTTTTNLAATDRKLTALLEKYGNSSLKRARSAVSLQPSATSLTNLLGIKQGATIHIPKLNLLRITLQTAPDGMTKSIFVERVRSGSIESV